MRIYDGSPRQDYEEVLRSIGAYLDHYGMRDVLLLEAPDGFIVQGLVVAGGDPGKWADAVGTMEKQTLSFLDDDIAKFMDDALSRRGHGAENVPGSTHYADAFRVIGRYVDSEKPRDVFFFEQGGAFVVRLHRITQTGSHHELAEFTVEDIASLVAQGPSLRKPPVASSAPTKS
jgi:hypothetical protein